MKSKILTTALLSVTDAVCEYYSADNCKDPYIVWKPESEGSELAADNQKKQYSLLFSVDVFSTRPVPNFLKKLETAFNKARISFVLVSVEYDSEKQIINYSYEVAI